MINLYIQIVGAKHVPNMILKHIEDEIKRMLLRGMGYKGENFLDKHRGHR